jgi:hypothetical protein
MTQNKAIGVIVVTAAAAYIVWRLQEAQGGAITFVNPFAALSPSNPSPGGPDGSGGTNPASVNFHFAAEPFKRAGNLSAVDSRSASRMTVVAPTRPPDEMTKTAQPQRPTFLGEKTEFAPNLGDANFSAWDYLASTPPELAWGLRTGGGGFWSV